MHCTFFTSLAHYKLFEFLVQKNNVGMYLPFLCNLVVVPICLAYSHNGVRQFAKNRWNSFKSPMIG